MRILHVNDVASVGSILARASGGRDALYQPYLRGDFGAGRLGSLLLAGGRAIDALAIRRQFERGGFTHLHVHYATFASLAELARLPYTLHVHGADVLLDPAAGGLKGRLAIRGLARARRVVVSTPDLLEPVRASRPDAIYIPNPMELPALAPRTQQGVLTAIMLSKMDYLKGWELQLQTMEALKRALPELRFRFFEHGQLPDAERARLRGRLIALGGEVNAKMPREVFLAKLAEYDFAIGQMEVGSLGMSEMEAMAAALPVIADARAHEAQGQRPPVIAPGRAVEAVRELALSEEARRRAGLAAREHIARVHDPRACLAALEAHLQAV